VSLTLAVKASDGSATCCGVPTIAFEPETVNGTASGTFAAGPALE
jgi:hypothetical protein